MTIPVLVDCDPGHDDAIALMLALASPEVEVLGVTTVAGTGTLDRTTANALRILEFLGRTELGVAAGADRPLVRDLYTAPHVHGTDGLAGLPLPPPVTRPLGAHAVDLLAERLLAAPGPVTLLPLGPLTNVALLLALRPQAAARIGRIVLMGGAIAAGNTSTAAEFNVYVDPEAAQRVFSSGIDVTMVGLDVTEKAVVGPEHVEAFRALGRVRAAAAGVFEHFLGRSGGWGVAVHDALAVAAVVRPELLTTVHRNVVVECGSEYTRGRTVVDLKERTGRPPNCRVAVDVDAAGFVALLLDRLARHA